MIQISAITYDGQGLSPQINVYPDECPFCHRGLSPRSIGTAFLTEALTRQFLQVPLLCTWRDCQSLFIAYYRQAQQGSGVYLLDRVSHGTIKELEVSDNIQKLSPTFVKIYQQANIAEQIGLTEICGVGYRKAIEFLVKDYAISKHPTKEEAVKNKSLGNCIKEYIADAKLKSMAQRATWLANDETHYLRTWEGKNLDDVKVLIRITLHWIEMEIEHERYEREMPRKL